MLIDIVFAILIFFACLKGLKKGFIVACFSIIAFIAGIAAALKLSAFVAGKLSENVNVSGKWLPVLSFIIVFLAVVFLVNMGAKVIQKIFEIAMLGWLNKLAGVLIFILLYSIIYSVFLFYAVELHIIKPGTIATSQVYPVIRPLAPKIISMMGNVLPFMKDIFSGLENFFTGVANKTQH